MDEDIVIVGAGCAGLSLASYLVHYGVHRQRKIVILDPRTEFLRDHTWCYWPVESHLFENAVKNRWFRWRVHDNTRSVERSSSSLPYCHIPADAFYQTALQLLNTNIDIRLGVRVNSLIDEGHRVHMDTEQGSCYAQMAFDSRPANHISTDHSVSLYQHFRGHFVRAQPGAFNPSLATLMDFRCQQTHGIHFFYVLPFSDSEALVESTFIGQSLLPTPQAYEPELDTYLREHCKLHVWKVTHSEYGVIPMTRSALPMHPSPRIYNIGLRGGLAKASTGYAFLAIQRFSKKLAQQLVEKVLPDVPELRPKRTQFLDSVFLSFLEQRPDLAPETFVDLFERVEPAALIRFLSDRGSMMDDLRVIRSAPALPLLKQTFRTFRF